MHSRLIRVCHVALTLDIGGLEKCVANMCESQDKREVLSSVVCLDRIGTIGDVLREKGYRVDLLKRKGGLDFKLVRNLKGYLVNNSIDIVHSHSGCMLYATLAGKLANARAVIHTDHGRHFPERRVVVIEELFSSLFIDRIIPVSEELKNYLWKKLRFPRKKLEYISNGIDTETFFKRVWKEKGSEIRRQIGVNNDEFLIGTIGRVTQVKNQSLLIEAFNHVLKRHKNCKLLIIGNGPELHNLRKLAKNLEISERVLFPGERDNIPQLLSGFDLFVLPSLSEGTSITLLEALSCSVPVIASNVGGNSKLIVHGKTGLLFDQHDEKELAEKICSLISDREKAHILAQSGRAHVLKHYSLHEMNRRYLALYRNYTC